MTTPQEWKSQMATPEPKQRYSQPPSLRPQTHKYKTTFARLELFRPCWTILNSFEIFRNCLHVPHQPRAAQTSSNLFKPTQNNLNQYGGISSGIFANICIMFDIVHYLTKCICIVSRFHLFWLYVQSFLSCWRRR